MLPPARIFQHLTARARNRCATTYLRSIVVVDGLQSPNRLEPHVGRTGSITYRKSLSGSGCGLA